MPPVPGGVFDNTLATDAPPSYDDIAARKSMEHTVEGREGPRPPMETVQEGSGDITLEQRRERNEHVRGQS